MDKIVFRGLTDLLLDEGNKDVDTIVAEAHERYGFPKDRTRVEVFVAIGWAEDKIKHLPDGTFQKINPGSVYHIPFLHYAKTSGALMDMGIKRLYDDFKERFGPGSEEQWASFRESLPENQPLESGPAKKSSY